MLSLELLAHLRVTTYPIADVSVLLEGQFGIGNGVWEVLGPKMKEFHVHKDLEAHYIEHNEC